MILIASNLAREAEALVALFATRQWASESCRSVTDLCRIASMNPPRVVLVRHRLGDGYSDDVLLHLREQLPPGYCTALVLVPGTYSTADECRQMSLGAQHVLRDPIRGEVLLQLVARYRDRPLGHRADASRSISCYEFAGVTVHPREHRLAHGSISVQATPKVIELVHLLHHHAGKLVSYTELYEVIFLRRFAGETSNCRVLLAKADDYFRQLGANLRAHVKVVAKTGYLYSPARDNSVPARVRKRARR